MRADEGDVITMRGSSLSEHAPGTENLVFLCSKLNTVILGSKLHPIG